MEQLRGTRSQQAARLPTPSVLGLTIPVAATRRIAPRLLGLALLRRARAGTGLLIPDCRSVHTFGMRFPLDIVFLDGERRGIAVSPHVGPGRVVGCRRADAVLELPGRGERFRAGRTLSG